MDVLFMKDEKVWDYSQCQIGHPCKECTDTCSFKIETQENNKENEESK